MKVLIKSYKVAMASLEQREYKVLPFIGRMHEQEGKETKVIPKLDEHIGFSYDGRDRPPKYQRKSIDILRDKYPDAMDPYEDYTSSSDDEKENTSTVSENNSNNEEEN